MAILDFELIQRNDLVVFIITHQDGDQIRIGADQLEFKSSSGFEVCSNHQTFVENDGSPVIYIKGETDSDADPAFHYGRFECAEDAETYAKAATEALNEFIKNGGFAKPNPKTVWDLEEGDQYWVADGNESACILEWDGDEGAVYLRNLGEVFLSKSEAKKEADRRKAETQLVRLIAEFNNGWVPDWNDGNESKRILRFDHHANEIVVDYFYWQQHSQAKFYLKPYDIPEELFKEMSRLFKISIGVEE